MQEVAEHQRQLEALPDERESRQEEERLAAEIQGLEKTCQYQDIDMKATLQKQHKTDAEVHFHPPAHCCLKLVPDCFSIDLIHQSDSDLCSLLLLLLLYDSHCLSLSCIHLAAAAICTQSVPLVQYQKLDVCMQYTLFFASDTKVGSHTLTSGTT